ncbi:acyl-CoA dehydrogenase [Rhodococcus sp. 05-2256-B2]|uniref:acyl-CoA dehydrogenase family protein n=1 Tax=Nocardiaceae TaxID=85025 RepID=UPI00050CB672|nr:MULTISPECIES: acyl-CoA dehydrogenase family protein [Rhodococcus]OZD87638.1 acyl-CoA dehydrogenase [Rhodococcus sp. 05-2256-B4]OZD89903.1 acyl-CoA dehydrogenase [Rhodococcus sp. 05-2256-B2]OZD92221.1 acyl-CoA dehydrogenase [Rhodococcus sp. 05-2256-B3]OZD98926.1 acyl-CoA dehydrogenase [Rhodococcus sp. 05-2256-B1]
MDFSLTDEQEQFRKSLRAWIDSELDKNTAREWEGREFEYPFELWDKMSKQGLHGIGLPEEYGGQGGDVMTQMIVARELARTLGGLTWIWGVSSFCAKSVALYAQEEVKQELLPKLADGEIRMSIALTEPSGGTDVLGSMKTVAKKVEGGWRITGQKIWSTAAHVADYLMLVAKSDPNADKASRGMTIFLVPGNAEGITTRQIPKVGMKSVGSCEVWLDDVFVEDRLVVGEVNKGWYQMLETLNNERIMVGALCTGVLDGVFEDALAYLKEREAFGKPIGQFQSLQHFVADMAMWQKQAELMTNYAAWRQEQGLPCGTESTMAKVVASELAGKAADLGMQILGGMGYALETDMQRYWRDVRLYRIGPITSEMARNQIAESYGLPRSF